MSSLLKLLADAFHITEAVTHWRLTISLLMGSTAGCVVWIFAPTPVAGAVFFCAIVAIAATLGLIWERRR
jgi:hypothetical protein